MSLQQESRRHSGPATLENAHISQEFHSRLCASISNSQLQTPKNDDDAPPTSPHEDVERWINTCEPVFSSSEEDLPQDDVHSSKSSVYSEDDLSLGAEAVLYPYQVEKRHSTSTSSTSKDTDSADQQYSCRKRIYSDPTSWLNSRESDERIGGLGSNTFFESRTSAEDKRARWRNSIKCGSRSLDSVSSDLSTPSSISELLNALDCDPEQVLTNLGFYEPDLLTRIPDRFFQNQSLAKGISVDTFRMNIDDDHWDACTNHSGGSWSDPGLNAIPARFERSFCKLHTSDDQQNGIRVPQICEPEGAAEESFDLMRHLRLQRAQQKVRPGNLLEPVTEELEVSSTGSGSVQTRIAKKQASEESEDPFGVTMRVWSTGHTPDSFVTPTDKESLEGVAESCVVLPDDMCKTRVSLFSRLENSNLSALDENARDLSDAERVMIKPCSSSLGAVTRRTLSPEICKLTVQESFEMEEVATDEGDISKEHRDEEVGKEIAMVESQRLSCLSRTDSGDSSGFGEGQGGTEPPLVCGVSAFTIEGDTTITINCNDFGNDKNFDDFSSRKILRKQRTLTKQKQISDEKSEEILSGNKTNDEEIKEDSNSKSRRKLGANLDLYFFNSTESNQTVQPVDAEEPESPQRLNFDYLRSEMHETFHGSSEGCVSDCPSEKDISPVDVHWKIRREYCLHEINILEKSIDKYQAGLNVLESISTAHEIYHTKKTLIRMASEVCAIQSLRRMISEEMTKAKRLLLERKKIMTESVEEDIATIEPVNSGITQKMADLLREQSALQDELMRLANDVLAMKKQAKQTESVQHELETVCSRLEEERNKIELEVRTGLIEELRQSFSCEIERLQLEIQVMEESNLALRIPHNLEGCHKNLLSKDDMIQKLKKKLDAVT